MGGILGKSKSKTKNVAYPWLKDTLGGTVQNTGTASDALMNLLGLGAGGSDAADGAFQNWQDSTGFDFQMDQGMKAITGSNAAKGLLNSGSTLRALQGYGQKMAQGSFSSYLDQLLKSANLGLGAGQIIGNAGQTSTKSEKPGLGGAIGSIGAAMATGGGSVAASDRRLKKDIVPLYKLENGLQVYSYKYINDHGPYTGVMADEVAKIIPEALGPVIDGYATVDYAKIGAL